MTAPISITWVKHGLVNVWYRAHNEAGRVIAVVKRCHDGEWSVAQPYSVPGYYVHKEGAMRAAELYLHKPEARP